MSTRPQSCRGFRGLGIALALLNVLLWFSVPPIRTWVLAIHEYPPGKNMVILSGVQELIVYFDVWLSRSVFPIVYTLGFAVIPFLVKPALDGPMRACDIVVVILILGCEAVWLFLIFVGVFCRGPNWNFYWPWEQWELRVEPYNPSVLSDYFWYRWLNRPVSGMHWSLRELPGFALIGGYFLSGFVLAGLLYRASNRASAYWRWAVLMTILQLASIVPIKILCRWLFNMKYVIYLPEYDLNL
jgi:hypothetical protein